MCQISRPSKLSLTVAGAAVWGLAMATSSIAQCVGAEDIQKADIASTAQAEHWGSSFSFSKCVNRTQTERCWFYITRTAAGSWKFSFFNDFVKNIKMRDNFHQAHSVIRGAVENARCGDMSSADLDQDEGIWFFLDFDHPDKGINAVTIVMPSYIMDGNVHETMTFKGPAETP